jgi:hypothetical protein
MLPPPASEIKNHKSIIPPMTMTITFAHSAIGAGALLKMNHKIAKNRTTIKIYKSIMGKLDKLTPDKIKLESMIYSFGALLNSNALTAQSLASRSFRKATVRSGLLGKVSTIFCANSPKGLLTACRCSGKCSYAKNCIK